VDNFIETKRATQTNRILALSTGVLFGCSFPPFPLGVLACVSLVPLLLLIERLGSLRKQILYSYISFFIASCIALYWIGGFTHAKDPYLMLAGGLVLVWEPFFFSLIVLAYLAIRRNYGLTAGLVALPFVWVTFEWLHAYGEFSFPWLTLGNSQTYQLGKIQFAEYTGVYGISLWILIINVLFFLLLIRLLRDPENRSLKRNLYLGAAIVVVYLLPDLYSSTIDENRFTNPASTKLNVAVVQPNLDPWEKWGGARSAEARWGMVDRMLSMTRHLEKSGVQVAIWPETAILFDLPTYWHEYSRFKAEIDSLGISVVSGYASFQFYGEGDAPTSSSVIRGSTIHYDSYNSIFFVQPRDQRFQRYAKMRLVPFAERIPYANAVPFLIEPLRWSVGISNWGIGKDSTVFNDAIGHSQFLAMVCYESIFPEFVASFVKRGAQYLVFVTNDSWWGNTSGARQHNQFAILRSIENRRWVVRCANGGISSFIDPMGRMYDATQMYTETIISRAIEPRTEQTFYTRHGDWLARASGTISGLFLLASLLSMVLKNPHREKDEPPRR
jgi:apolipoprotein N-acyltransferase